jgi:hypothetical protein
MRIVILLVITAVLPIAWLVSDIRSRPMVRRIWGVMAILWSFGVASLVGLLQEMSANTFFSSASKDLVHASVQALRDGKTEAVVRELSRADEKWSPSYEGRARYREIVDKAVEGMKKP